MPLVEVRIIPDDTRHKTRRQNETLTITSGSSKYHISVATKPQILQMSPTCHGPESITDCYGATASISLTTAAFGMIDKAVRVQYPSVRLLVRWT